MSFCWLSLTAITTCVSLVTSLAILRPSRLDVLDLCVCSTR